MQVNGPGSCGFRIDMTGREIRRGKSEAQMLGFQHTLSKDVDESRSNRHRHSNTVPCEY